MSGSAGSSARGPTAAAGPWAERGWRSHTFPDGMYAITPRRLDRAVVTAIRRRVRELLGGGRGWLILDLSEAGALGREERRGVTEMLDVGEHRTRIAVVLPHGATAHWLAPEVHLAGTMLEARLLLDTQRATSGQVRHGPGEALSPADRHELAVRQSLRWAETAAAEGDFTRALSWLATVEAIEGRLPAGWEQRRRAWMERQPR
jgi:hypothetical protein